MIGQPARRRAFLTLVGLLLSLLSVQPAGASILYSFDQSNSAAIGPDGGNYGAIFVRAGTADGLAAGTVRIDFGINIARPNDTFGAFGFNVLAGTNMTASNITTVPANWTVSANGVMDGFGQFSFVVGSSANADRIASGTIEITGLTAGQDTIASFVVLSSGNAGEGNAYFAAHLFTPDATGFVATGGNCPPCVPEPGSWVLLAGMMGGLAGWSLHRRTRSRGLFGA